MEGKKGGVMLTTLSVLAAALVAVQPPACEASPQTRAILDQLRQPDDLRLSAAERKEQQVALLRKALQAAADDISLNEAYQDLQIGRIGDERAALIAEYDQLLVKHPSSPVFLYLAARADYSRSTKQAIERLERALALSPEFGRPHLLLAQIYSAQAFADPAKVAEHLDLFSKLCPSSVSVFPELVWGEDKELVKRTAARIRKALAGRTDAEVEAAYRLVWSLEAALARSDEQAANQERVSKDAELLQGKLFARSQDWLQALEFAAEVTHRPELAEKAERELAALYPHSDAARRLALSEGEKGNPYPSGNPTPDQMQAHYKRKLEVDLALGRQWPNSVGLAWGALASALGDDTATPQQIGEAVDFFRHALQQDPEGMLAMPPISIDAAGRLVERGVRLEDVPDLVRQGLALTDREYSANSKSDLYPGSAEGAKKQLDTFYAFGDIALIEALVRLGRMPSAQSALLQLEAVMNDLRPRAVAGSPDRTYALLEAQFWYVKGMYEEGEGGKLDAMIDYRNSLAAFPLRGPRPDRRDEVMRRAQELWKQLGGTTEGWSDWATENPLTNFNAGLGGANAWSHLASLKPKLVITDSVGQEWKPQELARQVTFVTLWASWCGSCRAELPYAEKLYEHFKGRKDVAVLALNVDDTPVAMEKALKELRVAMPSVAARSFANDLLPVMALPASWLITPSKTETFNTSSDTNEGWLRDAIEACEKAVASK
jgi:thiol-disulfide isomerase/thioredoxin